MAPFLLAGARPRRPPSGSARSGPGQGPDFAADADQPGGTAYHHLKRTSGALIEAAREAFLDHGIDGASLAQIAEAAGCTTGAVYANFPGKDDLFLAVLDARRAGSVQGQARIVEGGLSLDDSLRAIARFLLSEFEEDPRWAPLVVEYWARAARNPDFRAAAVRRHADVIEAVSALIEQLAERHDMRLTIPAKEIARGGGALSRGVRLERAIGLDDGAGIETFEEMFLAFMRGLLRPATPPSKSHHEDRDR
jgi:AcrR family transcriptional regulator